MSERSEGSEAVSSSPQATGMKIARGLKLAVLSGVVGFAVPVVVMVASTLIRWQILGASEADRAHDLAWLPSNLTAAVIAFSSVFAAAGWATYAPDRAYRFLPTLGIVLLCCVPVWGLLASCGMAHHRYKSVEHPIIYLSEVVMLAVPPVVIGGVLSKWRMGKVAGD